MHLVDKLVYEQLPDGERFEMGKVVAVYVKTWGRKRGAVQSVMTTEKVLFGKTFVHTVLFKRGDTFLNRLKPSSTYTIRDREVGKPS